MEKIEIVFDAKKENVSIVKVLKDALTKPTKVPKGSLSLTNEIVKEAEYEKINISDSKRKKILKAYAEAEKLNDKLKDEWSNENKNRHWSHNPYQNSCKKIEFLKINLERIFKGYKSNAYTFYGGGAIGVTLVK